MSGYLSPDDAETLVEQSLNQVRSIRENLDSLNSHAETDNRELDAIEVKLSNFQIRSSRSLFGDLPLSKIAAYWNVFQALAEVSRSPREAKDMIEAILSRLDVEA